MIKEWHILISGFTQTLERQNGMSRLWLKMRPVASPTTCVQIYTWDADWDEVSGFIALNSADAPTVNVYAYSWGAGWGFVKLAERLSERGLEIRNAVLCDPVYRNPYLPTWFSLAPRSLFGERTIRVPMNVREVRWFYQTQNKPAGHEPESNGRTKIHRGVQLHYPHAGMEDSVEFHQAVLRQ